MIYLIRHGRTEANQRHLYCGSTDLPLSAQGREALEQLHYEIEDAAFFTSGMRRTEQTLEALFGQVSHACLPEFREIDFGAFEMHSYEQLREEPAYQAWLSGDNERNVPPGGESGAQMRERVLAAFRRLQEREGNAVLVTHGGVIAAIMEACFPEAGKNRYQWQPEPGYGYCLSEGRYWAIP